MISNITIMNTRLKQFIAAENITQAQLADTINVVRASVSHILAGRNKPSYEFISGLMRHYPNLNMEWLMFGKGKMYKDTKSDAAAPLTPEITPTDDVEAGYGELFGDEIESPAPVQLEETPAACDGAVRSVPSPSHTTPGLSLSDIKTLINASQRPTNQRKLIKITAFFDDGTFQELMSV